MSRLKTRSNRPFLLMIGLGCLLLAFIILEGILRIVTIASRIP